MSDFAVAALICGTFLLFCAIIAAGTLISKEKDAEQMKACVTSGHSWIRVDRSYECK